MHSRGRSSAATWGTLDAAKAIETRPKEALALLSYPWVRYQTNGSMSTHKNAALRQSHGKAFASRRRDPAGKREAVLQTAAQLFLEKSYGRTTMNDVAEPLQTTNPALYHYFRTHKE